MIIGVKGFTYAKYKSGGDGAAIVYEAGECKPDMMVSVNYSVERDDSGFYADDHKIDGDNRIRNVRLEVELAQLPLEIRAAILGWTKDSKGNYLETADASPYCGMGFVYGDRYKGKDVYQPIWIYKLQMGMDGDNAETRGENINFQTRTIAGDGMAVQLDDSGKDVFRAVGAAANKNGFETYAEALTWLKGMANIKTT